MRLEDCTKAHQASECLIKNGIKGHPVAFKELADFDAARRKLSCLINNGSMHASWEEGAKLFSILHAKLARTPCRPSWLVNEMLNSFGRRQLLEHLEKRSDSVDAPVEQNSLRAATSVSHSCCR